jgi:hypothetical protein
MQSAFRAGGRTAWWRGLQLRIWQLQLSRKTATTDAARHDVELQLKDAERLREEAKRCGDYWLF